MATFTDKELHRYEAEIRKKPLAMLYRERNAVKKDPSPERQNIVKARIEALEDRERRIRNAREREEEKYSKFTFGGMKVHQAATLPAIG